MLARKTHLTTNLIQSLNSSLVEFLRAAELFALIQQLCVELNGLHLHICGKQICGIGECAMALQKYSVEIREIFLNCIRDLIGGRCSVRSDRYASESDNSFRHDRLCQRNACNSEGCGIYRMSMNNRSYVRSLLIYTHMHLDLR